MVIKHLKKLAVKYQGALSYVLGHRWKTIGSAPFSFFGASMLLAKSLPREMMPASKISHKFLCAFKLPVGSSIELTNLKMRLVERYLASLPEVEGTYDAIGGFGGDAVNQANAFLILVPLLINEN